MTTVERLRLTVIEELIEDRINGTTVAHKLNLSVRQIKRLKAKFKKHGHDGLMKNTCQMYMLFGLANLYIVRKKLLATI